MASALARITVSRENVRVAEEELSVARDRVENGVGATIEIDRAEDSLRQAREDAIDAQTDAAIAEIDYERATGKIRDVAAATGALQPTHETGDASGATLRVTRDGTATPAARPAGPAATPATPTSAPPAMQTPTTTPSATPATAAPATPPPAR